MRFAALFLSCISFLTVDARVTYNATRTKGWDLIGNMELTVACIREIGALGVAAAKATCEDADLPAEARGLSGGFCLASVVEAGWFRSSILNPISGVLIGASDALDILAVTTATNSGGSLFGVRFLALQKYSSDSKWTYPCYLLTDKYSVMCYYHATFGSVANNCYSEYFNLEGAAAGMVYGGLVLFYGGPMGVASLWIGVWFPFLSSLPLLQSDWTFSKFMTQHILENKKYNMPAIWMLAHTLVNPAKIKEPWNFGWSSYFSKAYKGASYNKASGTFVYNGQWYDNTTLSLIAAESANTQSAFVIFPFSFGGKAWTTLGVVAATSTPLKILSLAISLVMVKKLAYSHTVLVITGPVDCLSVGGCPSLDGGFSDNLPLTPILSQTSTWGDDLAKPTQITLIGPSSSMKIISYVLGQGPLGIWTFSGVNICPLPDPGWCTALTQLREWTVARMPDATYDSYMAIGDAYQVYRPEMQVVAPYCGDPLTIDEFEGTCSIDSFCYMATLVLPSALNEIALTPSPYITVLTLFYLGNSPLATRFVQDYIPTTIVDGTGFYGTMSTWFPNFSLVLPQKGGMGFTSLAGNALMDYLTYIIIRLSWKMAEVKSLAVLIKSSVPPCEFTFYLDVNEGNLGTIDWNLKQVAH